LALFFLVLMGLTALVSIQGAKSIFRPLEAMSRVVRSVRSGEPTRMPEVASNDEIGELAREFDAMLALLQERNRQISQWAERLEEKVQARTAELEKKNRELEESIRLLRQTRRQLVMAEKLAALGELTAGVAHEINNPTAVMLGNLDLMLEELGDAAEPVRGEIELIIEQIYRIKRIIDELLQYARPERYAGEGERVNVNQVVERTLPLVRHLRRKKEFEIQLDLQAVPEVDGRQRCRHRAGEVGPAVRSLLHHGEGGRGLWPGAVGELWAGTPLRRQHHCAIAPRGRSAILGLAVEACAAAGR